MHWSEGMRAWAAQRRLVSARLARSASARLQVWHLLVLRMEIPQAVWAGVRQIQVPIRLAGAFVLVGDGQLLLLLLLSPIERPILVFLVSHQLNLDAKHNAHTLSSRWQFSTSLLAAIIRLFAAVRAVPWLLRLLETYQIHLKRRTHPSIRNYLP